MHDKAVGDFRMINLLPPEHKSHLSYARRNTFLRGWVFVMLVALLGSFTIIGGGYIFMSQSTKNQNKNIESALQDLQNNDMNETKKNLNEISTNTNLMLQVLSKEVLFSKLLRQMGASLPAKTALDEIKIDSLDGSVALTALAKDVNSATQIQVNLSDPTNKIFEKADIENINCGNQSNKDYACVVLLKALFSKNNSYTYFPTITKEPIE